VLVVEDLEPVVEAADHERADGAHGGDVEAFGFAALEAALDGLGDGDGLGEGEADGGVDADAAIRGFLNGGNAGARGGDFDDHVGRELAEVDGLLEHGFGVAVVARVGLDGEAAVAAFFALEDGQEQAGGVGGDLFDDAPGEFVFSELGSAAASSRMRGFQTASSCLRT
jgi:hypothetical protein